MIVNPFILMSLSGIQPHFRYGFESVSSETLQKVGYDLYLLSYTTKF